MMIYCNLDPLVRLWWIPSPNLAPPWFRRNFFTHWPLRAEKVILHECFSILFDKSTLMTSQHWWQVNIGSGNGLLLSTSHCLSQCWLRSEKWVKTGIVYGKFQAHINYLPGFTGSYQCTISYCIQPWTLKNWSNLFQNVVLISGIATHNCNISVWNWSNTINIQSTL